MNRKNVNSLHITTHHLDLNFFPVQAWKIRLNCAVFQNKGIFHPKWELRHSLPILMSFPKPNDFICSLEHKRSYSEDSDGHWFPNTIKSIIKVVRTTISQALFNQKTAWLFIDCSLFIISSEFTQWISLIQHLDLFCEFDYYFEIVSKEWCSNKSGIATC